ncbi:MAG TPA: CHAT domain-containing protein [Candidatus Saccharimonadales bacterium]|nr:CHAT domain-containing protein [Candidatus Saccharimonadales bacterium]
MKSLGDAITANVQGFPEKAKQKAQEAAEGFAQHHNLQGRIRSQLEDVYAEQRRLKGKKCIDLVDKLRGQLAGTNYRWSQGHLALEDATCSNLKAQVDTAEENLALSRKISEEFHLPVLRLRTLAVDVSFKRLQHHHEESWQELKAGLGLYYQGTFPSERLYNFYSVMEQYFGDQHLLFAQRALLQQAITVRESGPPSDANIMLTGGLHLRLARSVAASGDKVLAEQETRKANAFFDLAPKEPSVVGYILLPRMQFAEEQLRIGAPDLALAALGPSLSLLNTVEDDFIVQDFDRLLGDSYRKTGLFEEAARTYEMGIVVAERTLNAVEGEKSRQEWISGTGPLYRGLVLNLLGQRKDSEALQLWEWSKTRSLTVGAARTGADWDEIGKRIFRPLPLGPETRLIYAVLEDRLQIWIVGDNQIKSRRVSLDHWDLEAMVRDFGKECSRPDSAPQELRKLSVQLGGIFLHEVAPLLGPLQPVVIELDPKIDGLPLAALIGPDGAYFDESHAIMRSPGVWLESERRAPEKMTSGESVLVVDASPAAGPEFLPGHHELAEDIIHVFPATIVRQPANTKWAKVGREMGSKEMFVFIGHGIRNGSGAALVYGDLQLTAKDFPPEQLRHLDLAILIACSSAVTRGNGPLGADNLVQHFLSAGVPRVVGSRWDVDSKTTTRLMGVFHEHLGAGTMPSAALSLARKQIRQEKPHPYYWAAFDLQGRTN